MGEKIPVVFVWLSARLECNKEIKMEALAWCGPLIQDGHHTGIRLGADGPAKALLRLDLHLRHGHVSDKGMEIWVFGPLFLLQSVRVRKGQAWDDQQGYTVARKIKTLPGGPGSQ